MAEINPTAQEQIDKIKAKCEQIKPLVVIRCITYNHEKYIRETLEGFVMQKTDFPFVAIVHDDASRDKTAEIIKEYNEKYPKIILPIFEKENLFSKHDGTITRVINKACKVTRAKYLAFCEGDDYWTDPNKLQKQVDFLEAHPDYGMCYGKVKRYSQERREYIGISGNNKCSFEDILQANPIPTLTALIRTEIKNSYSLEIAPETKNWKMGDKPLWLWISLHSKIKFLDDIMGVYRILPNSASHSSSFIKWLEFIINAIEIELFFINYSNTDILKERKKHILSRYRYMLAIEANKSSEKRIFRQEFKKYYKFIPNKYALLDTGLLIVPQLSTRIAKKLLLKKNKK